MLTVTGADNRRASLTSKRCSSLNKIVPFFHGSKVRMCTFGGNALLRAEICKINIKTNNIKIYLQSNLQSV